VKTNGSHWRSRATAGLGAVALAASLQLPARAIPPKIAHTVPGPCPIGRPVSQGRRALSAYSIRIIRCAAGVWSVPGGARRAVCIARRESGLNPRATSPKRQYLGLFQHSASDWARRYRVWTIPRWKLGPSALNPRTNAIVTMRMVSAARSWSAWGRKGC
jgi:hypothetical protein